MQSSDEVAKAIRQSLPTRGQGHLRYGIGCAWLGRKGEEMRDPELAALRRAYEADFRYFDTSSAYGESEIRVGQFLNEIDRKQIFLATKMHYHEAMGPEQIRQGVLRSMERLGTDFIDLMQIHDISTEAGLFDAANLDHAKSVVAELKAAGCFRFFGLATRELDLHLKGLNCGLFDSHLTFNDLTPLGTGAVRLFEPCRRNGVSLINASPLASGLLTGVDPSGLTVHPSRETRKKAAIEFFHYCRRFGTTPLVAALHFPLRFPDVQITLTGPSSSKELDSTLAALASRLPEDFWAGWQIPTEESQNADVARQL